MRFLFSILLLAVCLTKFNVNSQPVNTHESQTKTTLVPDLDDLVIPDLDLLFDGSDDLEMLLDRFDERESRFSTFNPMRAGLLPIF